MGMSNGPIGSNRSRTRMRIARAVLAIGLALWTASAVVNAHEVRPGSLALMEVGANRFEVVWKLPAVGDMRLALRPRLPDACRESERRGATMVEGAIVERWLVDCGSEGLAGGVIAIDGLQSTLTDVLVRITPRDGVTSSRLLRPSAPSFVVPDRTVVQRIAWDYFRLGVQHILLGIDHLLFVLGLLVIVGDRRGMLFKTISAFTIAHSLTLGAATLGFVSVPALPLNAAIALSIFFLGVEIARQRRGGTSLTIERPWAAAFGFGLLHGLGFASGLSTIGLSSGELAMALLLFNVGVEAGQIGFVAVYLAMQRALAVLDVRPPRWADEGPGYVVGSLGAYWTMTQLAIFVGVLR
jgi:HupE / UreJ protein